MNMKQDESGEMSLDGSWRQYNVNGNLDNDIDIDIDLPLRDKKRLKDAT